LLALALLATVAVAWRRSDASTIVCFNETNATLPPLLLQACNQTHTFPGLGDQESVRFHLKPQGPAGPIHLELAGNPPWIWDGSFIQPHGGCRISLRLLPNNQVEAYADVSWWRRSRCRRAAFLALR
jgi:hypothetical protein